MSFWLDWVLLLFLGIIIVGITKILGRIGLIKDEYRDKWIKRWLMGIGILVFFLLSIALFAGFTMGTDGNSPNGPVLLCKMNDSFFSLIKWFYGPYYAMHPNATSTEFMFSSGEEWLRNLAHIQFNNLAELGNYPMHLMVGIFLFTLYPILLYMGVRLGELLFGSRYGKKGIFKLGFFIILLTLLIFTPIYMWLSFQNSIIAEWSLPGAIIIAELAWIVIFTLDFMLVQRK